LKPDRDRRLVSTGLKWSVLSTNSWQDMMTELKLYVREKVRSNLLARRAPTAAQTNNGKNSWDGNVPTNYRIKSNIAADGSEIDEEKNLGRWINRQRSLFQSGKLKKERQKELEDIGLKWSVLSTSTWQVMFEALGDYAKTRRDAHREWDGNVPANYKTAGTPQKVRHSRATDRRRPLHRTWADGSTVSDWPRPRTSSSPNSPGSCKTSV